MDNSRKGVTDKCKDTHEDELANSPANHSESLPIFALACSIHPEGRVLHGEDLYEPHMYERLVICMCLGEHKHRMMLLPQRSYVQDGFELIPFCDDPRISRTVIHDPQSEGKRKAKVARKSKFRALGVFCGATPVKISQYPNATFELGQELLNRGIGLVYGGGNRGHMGLVARVVEAGGGHVMGIIPRPLMGVLGSTAGEVKMVSSMQERKTEMIRNSDAFIALPGGFGTLDELFEVISLAQMSIHRKPVGLLNVNGYYDPLLNFLDEAVKTGFIDPMSRKILVSANDAKSLMQKLEDYVPIKIIATSGLQWDTKQASTGPARTSSAPSKID